MSIDNSILREQMRQQERQQQKQQKLQKKKREEYFKSLSKKKKHTSDIITVSDYKKLTEPATRKTYNNLKRWFNIYIKVRDLFVDHDGRIKGRCIACGKLWVVEFWEDGTIKNNELWCASHYFLADEFTSVEFYEANVNLSCYKCNRRLSGNLAMYKIHLEMKIGHDEFRKLEFKKNETLKLNVLDMIKLKELYMDKAKKEIKRLGIKL
jgi:hypothetical protein